MLRVKRTNAGLFIVFAVSLSGQKDTIFLLFSIFKDWLEYCSSSLIVYEY